MRKFIPVATLVLTGLLSADPALAYIGPGAGLAALTAVLGLVGSFLLGIVSIIYYPIKRLVKRRKNSRADRDTAG
jgi:hypothetical protein